MLILPISEKSQTGDARRQVVDLAERLGLGETAAGRAALIATELATNLVKHASAGGMVLAQPLPPSEPLGLEIVALDRGPGMTDLVRAIQDGYSTVGTSGNGLGAIERLSDLSDFHSTPGVGTAILSRLTTQRESAGRHALEVGGLSVPKPGEEVSGDGWVARRDGESVTLLVVDGLGHGPGAATARIAAMRAFGDVPVDLPPAEILGRLHAALAGTRGAAIAIARVSPRERGVRFAGIGNIAATIVSADRSRGLVSHNGTAGVQARKIQEFGYDWPEDGLLVLHSDGLASRWSLDRYPGLTARHPALIAGVLFRDFARGSDDVTVAAVAASGRA